METINEQPQTVNLGVTLSVTPQISADGWAMLNITPSVTRLIGTAVSPAGGSTAPILDVSEASTMVRVRSGEMVILGGLIQEETSDTNRGVPGLGEGLIEKLSAAQAYAQAELARRSTTTAGTPVVGAPTVETITPGRRRN